MNITLKKFNTTTFEKYFECDTRTNVPLILQYADFNVINYLYENKYDESVLAMFTFYPDSTAVYFYLKYIRLMKVSKIISTDLQEMLLDLANKYNTKIFLLGGSDEILLKACDNILAKYCNLKLTGFSNGYEYCTKEVVAQINDSNTFLVLVGLGNERQEKWLVENAKKLNAKMIVSVGGWFEYLANPNKRAPLILRKLNLEWLFKLLFEFRRVWKRYFYGIPKFYYRVLIRKINILYGAE